MHSQRLRKQLAYATLYVAVFCGMLIGGTALLVSLPSSPTPTPAPTPSFLPVTFERIDVVNHDRTVDVIARVHNPNPRAGIVEYPVTFIFFNEAGQEMHREDRSPYILPGSVQYITLLSVPVNQPVKRVVVDNPATPKFIALPPNLDLPSFNTFVRERAPKQIGGQSVEELKGVITNTSTFDWQRVEVIAVGLDASGQAVGVGTTFVGTLRVGENREFTIQWPTPVVPVQQVVTIATTNPFEADSIIRVIGDPAQLR